MQDKPQQKTCSICQQSLPLEAFVRARNKPDGRHSQCKTCSNARMKQWRLDNLEYVRDYDRRWSRKNAEAIRLKSTRYREANRERNQANLPAPPTIKRCGVCGEEKDGSEFYRTAATKDGFSHRCKQCASLDQAEWRKNNPELAQARDRESWRKYQAKYQRNYKRWAAENRTERNAYRRALHAEKMRTDEAYRWEYKIRNKVYLALRGIRKSAPTERLIGCSFDQLKQHLESLWQPGMSWDNYGKHQEDSWEIDHRIPVSSFNLVDPEQQKQCFHFSNLQPLWRRDNRAKSKKLDWKP